MYVKTVAAALRERNPGLEEEASLTFAYFLITTSSFPVGAIVVGIEPSGKESKFLNEKYRLVFLFPTP